MRTSASVAAAILALQGCSLCGDETLRSTVSADGQFEALIVERNCGATTSFVTHVILRDRWLGIAYRSESVFVARDRPEVTAEWRENSRTLEIAYQRAQVYKQLSSWRGVGIRYRTPKAS